MTGLHVPWTPKVGDVVEWSTPFARRWHSPYRVLHTADLGAHGRLIVVIHVLPDGGDDDWPHALWPNIEGVEIRPLAASSSGQLSLLEVTS